MTSKCISKLARSRPPSASLISLDLGLQVHVQTSSITASRCISEFTQSRSPISSPNSLDHGLEVHLLTRLFTPFQCISEFTRSRSPIASPNSLDRGLQLHHLGATAGVQRYRGNGGGLSDGEYILGRPRGR
jgi:hypothetical protein